MQGLKYLSFFYQHDDFLIQTTYEYGEGFTGSSYVIFTKDEHIFKVGSGSYNYLLTDIEMEENNKETLTRILGMCRIKADLRLREKRGIVND